jgi:phage terminase large subunit-like protein
MQTAQTSQATNPLSWIAALPADAQDRLLAEIERRLGERKLELYRAYEKQLVFHEAGATYRERLLMAANRVGKTYSAGAETAYHLTGRYPHWWRGKQFRKGHQAAAASETGLLVRDGVQRILFGWPANALGTGLVPKDAIKETVLSKFGPSQLFEMVRVRHGGGGDVQADESVIYLRSYDQGRERIQAMELAYFWLDEEPDLDYYMEALTRTNITLGPVYLTFTPLKGMSDVVKRFLLDKSPGTHITQMDIADAEHIPADVRQAIIDSYPAHERDARVHGIPVLGSGRVFVIPEENIRYESFTLPSHWPRLAALDFGYDHPTAAVWFAHDRDTDTVYLYDAYRVKGGFVPVHASVLRAKGQWIPVAWPHDGLNDTAAGPQLAKQYRDEGINMLPEHAQFEPVSDRTEDNTQAARKSVEAGVQMMVNRMLEGRFKVAAHLADWWEEYRLYHRKDGKLVKVNDDLISATRYGLMCIEKAAVPPLAAHKLDPRRRSNWRAA